MTFQALRELVTGLQERRDALAKNPEVWKVVEKVKADKGVFLLPNEQSYYDVYQKAGEDYADASAKLTLREEALKAATTVATSGPAADPGSGSTEARGTTTASVPSLPQQLRITARLGNKSKVVLVNIPPKYQQLREVFERTFPDLQIVQYQLVVIDAKSSDESGPQTVISSDDDFAAALLPHKQTVKLTFMAMSLCRGFREFDMPSSCSYLGLAPMYSTEEIPTDDSKFEDGDTSKYSDYSALLAHLMLDYRRRIQVFGPLDDAVESTCREFISPLLLAAALIVKGVHLRAELSITGLLGKGPVDYVAMYEELQILVTEAKKDDFRKAYPQSMAQVAASRDVCVRRFSGQKRKFSEVSDYSSIPSSSIITNGEKWVFLRYEEAPQAEGQQEQQPPQPKLFRSAAHCIFLSNDISDDELRKRLDVVLRKIVGIFQLQVEALDFVKKRKAT